MWQCECYVMLLRSNKKKLHGKLRAGNITRKEALKTATENCQKIVSH